MKTEKLEELFRNYATDIETPYGNVLGLELISFLYVANRPEFQQAVERECEWTEMVENEYSTVLNTQCGQKNIIRENEDFDHAKYCWNCGGRIT